MADTTSHDTVGASTLAAPYFSPASPSPPEQPPVDSPNRLPSPVSSPRARSPSRSPPSSREASIDRAARELDARLAQYTVDFSQFPSGHGPDDALDENLEDEEADRLSAVGGPEDFTANLERYLLGEDDSIDQELGGKDEDRNEPQAELGSRSELPQSERSNQTEGRPGTQSQQPAVEDEPELGEYSEFGPPVDMSTPSHLLRRTTVPARDVTHLEDIEEDPDDEPSVATTPSFRKPRSPTNKHEKTMDDDLRRQVAELRQAVKDRDEQLAKNRKRVLEAASAGEEIKHLRGELQRKAALIEESQQSRTPRRSSISAYDFGTLQKQIADMQHQLQNRNSKTDIDAERLETIAMLRQQLSLTQDQLRKRDASLEETLAQLKNVTAAKELQLKEKNAEIDRLESSLSRAHRDYRVLEDRMVLAETKNRPLEERNSTLEADLTRAQSQVTAQENALKAMAADLPPDSAGGGTYSEILELIKDLGQPDTSRPSKSKDADEELERIREELARLRTESSKTASANKILEQQLSHAHDQAAESQILIQSIEAENTRLTKRAEELKSTLDQAQTNFNRLQTDHSEALETIERLQDNQQQNLQTRNTQPISPPSTPHATLEATHQAQIASLKTAHATAISSLRTAHADSTRKLRALLEASEKREADLRSELSQHPNQHQDSEDKAEYESEIASLRTEIKHLHAVIATKDETAASMDLRIARSVEKREREWERRVELLLKERETMSKALLWSWGEKEVPHIKGKDKTTESDKENADEDGGKRRQGYRYKYIKRT
ncbi:putative spindle pole body associated protein SnaD [Aspergillus lucknowensis]|uniref:Spindle pole body associated protein SnaD n=1 Tax=Aspergillus lucknowensis TaxID=176173 RepID=A0ABR4LGA8_9EURO